jgi:hypothetical protein
VTEHNWPPYDGDEPDGGQSHHDPGPPADGDPLQVHGPWTAHPWPEQHFSGQPSPDGDEWSADQPDADQPGEEQPGEEHAGSLEQSWPDGQHLGDTPADTGGAGMGHVGADPDALGDEATADPFPPTVDVGALPEPVDGFPWIDAGALGDDAADPGAPLDPAAPDSADLAAYAGHDLPVAGEQWHRLAASDDPATAALARFWRPTD